MFSKSMRTFFQSLDSLLRKTNAAKCTIQTFYLKHHKKHIQIKVFRFLEELFTSRTGVSVIKNIIIKLISEKLKQVGTILVMQI